MLLCTVIMFLIIGVRTVYSYSSNDPLEECRQYSTSRQRYAMPLLPNIFPFMLKTDLCTKTRPLIVGGTTAEFGEFPHMAALGYENEDGGEIDWLCGGSLISSRFILTAAHCIKTRRGEPQWVQIGIVNLNNSSENNIKVERSFLYPTYDPPTVYNDLGLIKLGENVLPKPGLRPICLSSSDDLILPGSQVIATGWGRTGFGLPSSRMLLKVSLTIVDEETCRTSYLKDKFLPKGISEGQFCAGPYDDDSQDTCQGDSGGPVQVISKDDQCITYLVGITSFGKYCGSGTPGVYMKIRPFLPWIENIVWPSKSVIE